MIARLYVKPKKAELMQSAVLFSEMTPEAEWEGDFNRWYDEEHIPLRMGVPGFAGAQRYRRNARDYLAVYDMADPGVLASDAYREIKDNPSETTAWMLRSVGNFTRYIGRPISTRSRDDGERFIEAPVLYPVLFTVPQDRLVEFDAWYEEDHVSTLLESPDWLACRRFDIVDGSPGSYNRLALHYLASEEALESPARAKARRSAWRDRLAAESWFAGHYMVFERTGARFSGNGHD
jgi:hypothetical protein